MKENSPQAHTQTQVHTHTYTHRAGAGETQAPGSRSDLVNCSENQQQTSLLMSSEKLACDQILLSEAALQGGSIASSPAFDMTGKMF